jgi:hypothetical protein
MKASPVRLSTVCKRRCRKCDRLRIGAPDSICPRCGTPFDDAPYRWKTRNHLCPSCGEVIGTTRRRNKYDTNRWPATVCAKTCEDCGTALCSLCYSPLRTSEVIGSYRHRIEGGSYIRRPRYRYAVLCKTCAKKRIATREEAKNAALFRCPECSYEGRRDSFVIGKTLDDREYVKGCPKCGFSWRPAIMGILRAPDQKRIEALQNASRGTGEDELNLQP